MTNLQNARVEAACKAYQAAQNADPYDFKGRMSDALAAADAVVAVDAREYLHAKCDCVPDLGPAHCHLCSNERGAPVPWPECSAVAPVVTVDGLQERIEDTLAYYQCRETNPKADHPSMGYHAFSEEQREFLRERKAEAAAEIVRMILALLRGGEYGEAVA